MKFIDLTGQRFGKLIVVERMPNKGNSKWRCVCDCGEETFPFSDHLRTGVTVSCGCKRKEAKVEIQKNTMSGYNSWRGMTERCTNKNHQKFEHYGGRGIKVCDRWTEFYNFLEDMGERPSPSHSIDRIDVDGNYEPSNCKWSTQSQQTRNKRVSSKSKTGVTGVYWHKTERKWTATITTDEKRVTIGYFKNLKEATEARKEAELKYWGKSS